MAQKEQGETLDVLVDKHGRPLGRIGRGCVYLCRGTRPCKNQAMDSSDLCLSHLQLGLPKAAAAAASESDDDEDIADSDSDQQALETAQKFPSRISSDQKRMKNPFSKAFATLPTRIDFPAVYEQPALPLCLDIGCARGGLVLKQAERNSTCNWLGVEIRGPLADQANVLATKLPVRNAHFVGCRMDGAAVDALCIPAGLLGGVTILFPDPWFRKRHHRRLTIQTDVLRALARAMHPGAPLLVASDCEAVVLDARHKMQELADEFELYRGTDDSADIEQQWPTVFGGRTDDEGYLLSNPLAPFASEREHVCSVMWRRVFRLVYRRR
jgi:tRNA (guanine-N7-)-methyltransferase